MLSSKRRTVNFLSHLLAGLAFVLVTSFFVIEDSFIFALIIGSLLFVAILIGMDSSIQFFYDKIEKNILYGGESLILTEFAEQLRVSYTGDDFIKVLQTVCEDKGDMSVLYVNRENNYVLYNSPDRITLYDNTSKLLEEHFPGTWQDGYYYFNDDLSLTENKEKARGFFFITGKIHLYFFCRYTRSFDDLAFLRLYKEFTRFQTRLQTIESMSRISELSTEWNMLAKTQQSFLPQQMPDIEKLDIAAYFRPLVNVSGDYYTILPLDEKKTLVMLGDVSGKGLAAALVMGLVMNIVKIINNKEDLVGIVRAIDKGIKRMNLQDKYTVLFIGIIDTETMRIRYINASMSDPIIVTRAPDGYRIKPLTSNCSVVGIIDLPEVQVDEKRLFRDDLILMASDGVSEVMDDEGIELGDTDLYINTIQGSAGKTASEFVADIADLVLSYNGDKKLRDDVTMLAVKIGG